MEERKEGAALVVEKKRDGRPSSISAVMLVYEGESYDILNMLINFTLNDCQFWWTTTSEYVQATYLRAYVHLFENQTIINEQSVDLQYDKPYIDGPNDPDWNSSISSHVWIELVV